MVAAGLVTPNEATWLGSMRHRKAALRYAAQTGGKPARRSVQTFATQVVELAFVRDRIDRGFGDERVATLLNKETYAVYGARSAAPALQALSGYRAS
jgi:protease PrsW